MIDPAVARTKRCSLVSPRAPHRDADCVKRRVRMLKAEIEAGGVSPKSVDVLLGHGYCLMNWAGDVT